MARKIRPSAKQSKPANSKGSPKRLSPQWKTGGANVRTGRRFGPGMRPARSHD